MMSAISFRRKRFLKVFTILWHGSHLDHVTITVLINVGPLGSSRLHIQFSYSWPSGFTAEPVWTIKSERPWTKVKEWPWPLVLIYFTLHSTNFYITDFNSFWEIHYFDIFPHKSERNHWPFWKKVTQGSSFEWIWKYLSSECCIPSFNDIGHLVLKKKILKVFTTCGQVKTNSTIPVMWPGPFKQTFIPTSHRSSLCNLTLIGPVVSEMLKDCGRQMTTDNDDGQ